MAEEAHDSSAGPCPACSQLGHHSIWLGQSMLRSAAYMAMLDPYAEVPQLPGSIRATGHVWVIDSGG